MVTEDKYQGLPKTKIVLNYVVYQEFLSADQVGAYFTKNLLYSVKHK